MEIVGNDNTSRIILGTNLDGAEIKFVGEDNTPQMRFVSKSDAALIKIESPSGGKTIMDADGIGIWDTSGAKAVMLGDAMIFFSPNKDSTIYLTARNGIAGVNLRRKSKDGNESHHQSTWEPIEDNDQTVIYKERSTRTRIRSLDIDSYKLAPGNTIK